MSPRINTADWIRLGTAARLLGVTRARAQQLRKAGLLTAIEIDGIWHVRRADVERRAGTSPRRRPPA